MARPRKQTVDYFPHDTDCSESRTLTIVQTKHGNDGYAFWFKMLQLLGKTAGHYYNCSEPADWEFLLAKTHVSDSDKAKGILQTFVTMGAIDKELYAHGVIWCQNFVDRLEEVYRRREEDLPKKPVIVDNKVVPANTQSTITEILGTESKESKVKESKLEESNSKAKKNSNVFQLYEQEIGKLTQSITPELQELADQYPYPELERAFKIAATNNKRRLSYIKGILKKSGKKQAPAEILEGEDD